MLIYNLLSPFSVACIYMHLKLVIWNWIIYQESHLWKRMISPVSHSLSRSGTSVCVGMSTGITAIKFLFRRLLLRFHGSSFPTTICSRWPGLLTLQAFCSLFRYDHKALGLGVVLYIYTCQLLLITPWSVLWVLISCVFCSRLDLLQREASMIRGQIQSCATRLRFLKWN